MKKFKAGSFRLLHGGVYKVLSRLSPEQHREHRIFIYLEAGPNSHYSGLFHASPADISKNTLVPVKEVPAALRNLHKMGLIFFDEDRQLVHVRGMLKRQLGTQTLNNDNAVGIAYYTERMPEDSPAVIAFMEENREISGFDEILLDLSPQVPPPGLPQGATPTRDFRLKTSDEKTMKRESVISPNDRETTRVSSTSCSTPQINVNSEDQIKDGSPSSSPEKPTPRKKEKGNATATPRGDPADE